MQSFTYTQPTPAWGDPCGQAQRVFAPDDFVVDEVLGFSPDGEGEHVLLQVRKRGANTQWLARRLASFAKTRVADVGYCGLKDRQAVTTQWFSVPSAIANPVDWTKFDEPDVQLLVVERHERKLRTGSHQGNQFTLTLRQLSADEDQLNQRLEHIKKEGMPNYFGTQRFGRNGQNVTDALQWLSGQRKRPDRHKRSLWLSSIRSYLFNAVLSERIKQNTWNTLLEGERVMLNGSHSVFTAEQLDDDLINRCAELDIHPTGPLPGSGDSPCIAAAQEFEQNALLPYTEMTAALVDQKVKAARRALRVVPGDLQWQFEDDEVASQGDVDPSIWQAGRLMRVSFSLPSGSYATVLLDELVAPV